MPTASEIIVEFIKRQPEPVADAIAASFWMLHLDAAGSEAFPDNLDALRDVAYGWIDRGSQETRPMWAAAAVGVIDLHFAKPLITAGYLKRHAEARDSDALRAAALRFELRAKFHERARLEWLALREGALSLSVLLRQA